MGIIIDLILLAIVILSVFLAYKKGLTSLAIGLFGLIIAIVITFIIYKPVTNFIINVTSIDETIENSILDNANNIIQGDQSNGGIENQLIESAKNNILPETAKGIATNIVTIGVIIILIILFKIALKFIDALSKVITKIPIIKQFDKLGGIIYGVLRGIVLIYLALFILNIATQINSNNSIYNSVNSSYVGKMMYENNILNMIIK